MLLVKLQEGGRRGHREQAGGVQPQGSQPEAPIVDLATVGHACAAENEIFLYNVPAADLVYEAVQSLVDEGIEGRSVLGGVWREGLAA